MTERQLNRLYFDWMYQLVASEKPLPYRKLLHCLHDTEFTFTLPMDENRAEDGIDLRYRFGRETGRHDAMIASYLDIHPCSVLEMLIALSIRCEEHIMDDPDIGNRTGQWFWGMIRNMKLTGMSDSNFNGDYTDQRIMIFLNRTYCRNGEGGLFTVQHRNCDMRSVEIWYQMCWYLDEIA